MSDYDKWISQAEKDFDTAKYNLDGGKTEAGFFFLQQAAEKALKAVYIKNNEELIKSHDLFSLGKKVGVSEEVLEYCKKLTPAYQYTRYPDVPGADNLEDLEDDFVKYSEEIIKWCKKNF